MDQNPIDAVDVWGDGAASGGTVCFRGEGRMLYVNTAVWPRTQSQLETREHGGGPYEAEDGSTQIAPVAKTCARIPNRGQVIFLPSEE